MVVSVGSASAAIICQIYPRNSLRSQARPWWFTTRYDYNHGCFTSLNGVVSSTKYQIGCYRFLILLVLPDDGRTEYHLNIRLYVVHLGDVCLLSDGIAVVYNDQIIIYLLHPHNLHVRGVHHHQPANCTVDVAQHATVCSSSTSVQIMLIWAWRASCSLSRIVHWWLLIYNWSEDLFVCY